VLRLRELEELLSGARRKPVVVDPGEAEFGGKRFIQQCLELTRRGARATEPVGRDAGEDLWVVSDYGGSAWKISENRPMLARDCAM
jgi:hypothetical protein